jgi:hypothetical protein
MREGVRVRGDKVMKLGLIYYILYTIGINNTIGMLQK